MNKAELLKEISHKTGFKRDDSKKALDAIFETITGAMVNGEKVQIMGFGSFEARNTKERMGVNPQNPTERLVIPAGKKVYFKPSKALKETINA